MPIFRVSRWTLIISAATLAIVTASPLVWMVSASLKEPGEIFNSNLIPHHPTLDNFRYVFTQLPFLRYILNTFFVAGTITVIALLFHSMAGYAFARLRFPGREAIFLAIFSTSLVSLQVIIVPLFILVQKMGMVNTYAGLIIPVTFNAFGWLVQLAIASFQRQYSAAWNYIMAASVVVAMPTWALFFLFQRQLVESIKTTGIK